MKVAEYARHPMIRHFLTATSSFSPENSFSKKEELAMRKRIFFSAFVVFLLCFTVATELNIAGGSVGAAEASQRRFNPPVPGEVVENTFLHIARDKKSKMIETMKVGKKVDILEEKADKKGALWYLVKTDANQGWIPQESVRALTAKAPAPAAKAAVPAESTGVRRIDPPVPAEVLEKSFLRADHDHKSKTLAACSEGAGVDIVGEWTAPNGIRWYQVKAEGVRGWIMAKFVRPLVDEVPEAAAVPVQTPAPVKPAPVSAKPAASGDYLTVTATGAGTSRSDAVERAWMEAVRLAVGVVISSKTEVTNDEISERIIAHSRGIIESYRVIDETSDGKRVNVTIEASVHRQTLVDATKTYGEAYVVDASTSAARDAVAKAKTEEEMKKTGMELLKEVMDSYGPEMFLTARVNPEIFYDKEKGRHTVEVIEVFNEKLFWDEFLPRLRESLDGVAGSKKKKTYTPEIRAENLKLTSEKYIIGRHSALYLDVYLGQLYPYFIDKTYVDEYKEKEYPVVIPDNQSTYTSYLFPMNIREASRISYDRLRRKLLYVEHAEHVENIVILLLGWWKKMDSHVTHMVSFLDANGDVLHVQPFETGPRGITIYRSLSSADENALLRQPFVFAPGFTSPFTMDYEYPEFSRFANYLYLDTTKMNRRWLVDEYMNDKMDRVKSVKLETIFEQ
ncbi:MAG: hypothetical protein EOM14_10725 [Clostridia bacterium]|nr:hypothetical protein [Clostridia bacterium]